VMAECAFDGGFFDQKSCTADMQRDALRLRPYTDIMRSDA